MLILASRFAAAQPATGASDAHPMDTTPDSHAWVASTETDGIWLKARVISQGEDGNAILEELDTKTQHTQPADVRGRNAPRTHTRPRPEEAGDGGL